MAPINPPTFLQAGTYSARLDRLSQAGVMHADPAVGGLAVRGGVRPTGSNTGLLVTQRASPGMAVTVAAGTAIVPASSAVGGCYIVHNDASFDVTIASSHATLARRDLIVARVRDAEYSGADNDWQLSVVQGTPAGSPVLPSTPAGAVALAQVQVNAAASSILNAHITDLRKYTTALGGTIPVTTADRPTQPYEGMSIYDTTLNRPLWWNGSAWHGYGDEGFLTTSELATYLAANNYVTQSFLTSQNYLTQANLDAMGWQVWTVNWGASVSNPSIGNGSIYGRYFRLGKFVTIRINQEMGTTTNFGSGIYSWSLPFPPANLAPGAFLYGVGAGALNEAGPGQRFCIPYIFQPSAGTYRIRALCNSTVNSEISRTFPWDWKAQDDLEMTLTYQVA